MHRCFQKWKRHIKTDHECSDDLDSHIAELYLVRVAQRECFGELCDRMQAGAVYKKAVKSFPDFKRQQWMLSLIKYVPFLDQLGILRMGGRLDKCPEFNEEQANPASFFHDVKRLQNCLSLIVVRLAHRAAETVLASLQTDLGLTPVGGMATVRYYLKNCFTCRLLRKERASQLMSSLPDFRVTPRQSVFTSISIDHAGPYDLKRGRSTEKRWLCLFVCNATSAIRLEMVESLETTAFLNALRRFLCLTGVKTKLICCDCDTTFVGARNALKAEMQKSKLNGTTLTNDWIRSRKIQ